ncbi:ATP-NAD kinase family protein [Halospeciosus flavus]|uniref:ATP-NAD kinase family protein n=1 Tax=Halospeciosus flavus TaxID=3032283 RepID=A0ABD5Z3V9_9EURY|nr:ATP-NAD kinase family protein [Halospeciosus flavus]
MRTIGFVVNPIAGMGGRVGLKGTDEMVAEARRRGAEQRAPERAVEALSALRSADEDIRLLTYGGAMGEDEAREAGFDPVVVGYPDHEERGEGAETSAKDTREAVAQFVAWTPPEAESDERADESGAESVDLILFVGGDGTAVDVTETLDDLDADVPVLGVPAGVKVYSSVFAVRPSAAGRIAATFERTEEREVNDIDEAAYREEGEVRTELKGIVRVPVAEELQSSKQLAGGTVESLAEGVAAEVEDGVTYVFGPGSTVGAIERELGFEGSPLGVDVWRDGEVLVADASEAQILDHLGERNEIVVSPIGGQGFVFGRGNQQLSPDVVRRCEVTIVASRAKLDQLGALRVDTGDEELDEELRGWVRVRTGKYETRMMQIV